MPVPISRRFVMLLAPYAVASGFADAQPAMSTAPPCAGAGTDAWSQQQCEQAKLLRSTCDDVPDPARGHCVRCVLANNPVACDALPEAAAAACRAHQSAIEHCVAGPADAAEDCVRRIGIALADRPASSAAPSRSASFHSTLSRISP